VSQEKKIMSTEVSKPQCSHIMDCGRPCQTPPLKGQPFCYYHRRLHATFILPGHPEYTPPTLDSAEAIQIALNHIYVALAKGLLDRRLAGSMLYCIQLASQNLRNTCAASKPVEEINPAMQQVLSLDENLEDIAVQCASPLTPRSTDTELRRSTLNIGVNDAAPITLDNDPVKAMSRSAELAGKSFSRHFMPEFCPEVDQQEWIRLTSDLPAKGEAGTAQQQLNCQRILQILYYNEMRRKMTA
jgi:hypothetical protein